MFCPCWLLFRNVNVKIKPSFGRKRRIAMSQIEMIEQEVKQLSSRELAAFRSWFIEFDAAEWDRQIEIDSAAGKLERLAQSAIKEHKAGWS
jgi:hypothetical protein